MADKLSESVHPDVWMARSHPRQYTTGTRRQVTPEWIARVRSALKERGQGQRWLELEAGLAKDRALTKALEQPLNEIDPLGLGLGQAEQLGHQLRRNRHDVLLPGRCVAR
jgi:hypothetical protein